MATLTSPSLSKLIFNVRNFLNSPNPANSFWQDVELADYLNKAVARYFVEVANLNEGQFITRTTLNITANTETVALPTDCFIVKAVRKQVSNGWVVLNYRPQQQYSYATDGGAGSETFFPCYDFRGNSLVLHPTPNFSETGGLEIEYMQFPDRMVTANDTMTAQVLPIFQELIEAYAIYLAKEKQALVNGVQVPPNILSRVDGLYKAMKEVMSPRSLNATYVIPFDPESY